RRLARPAEDRQVTGQRDQVADLHLKGRVLRRLATARFSATATATAATTGGYPEGERERSGGQRSRYHLPVHHVAPLNVGGMGKQMPS
ncbi:MAG TPA: hypothetical protein VGW11_05380, partial [Solirubrobacteraceae bacterium]|nr:hypothetical protein [Solirubrobacteraceae bacterium]